MYIICPNRIKLLDVKKGEIVCFELEGYHNYYAVYASKSGLRVLIYVGICQSIPRC